MNADLRPIKTAAEAALATIFAAAKGTLPGGSAVVDLRARAFDRFAAAGLPNRRVEEWKYTDLRAFMQDVKPLADAPDAVAKARAQVGCEGLASIEARRIVLVDGTFVPELSDLAGLEAGLAIGSLAQAFAAGDAVLALLGKVVTCDDTAVALNTAFMGDGAVIRIGAGVALARPIQLVFYNSGARPAAVFTRSIVVVEKGARAMLVESHEGPADCDYQVNTALELVVGDEAHVDHVKLTGAGSGSVHVASLMAAIGARARFNEFLFNSGAAMVRNQLFVRFAGEGAVAGIRGASLLRGRQHADTTVVLDHVAGGCTSRELFKSVLDDEARGVFQGRITVRAEAQGTDAKMATHALLLSETAEADNKPELEIYADDVQCGHGATTGALDKDSLFYFHARGIPKKEAEALLIEGFAGEAVEGIEHAGMREALMNHVRAWLAARG
jgi:Fe-S cluster assembly protein SufD